MDDPCWSPSSKSSKSSNSSKSPKSANSRKSCKSLRSDKRTSLQACFLLACNLALCFLVGGVVYGWAALQLLLEEDGVYRDACPIHGDEKCDSRTQRFLFIYTLGATAVIFGAAIAGFLVDWCGPATCAVLSGSLTASGLLLFGISDDDLDLFAVASVLIGAGGILTQMNAFPSAFIMPQAYFPMAMTWLNCLFDGSSVLFLVAYKVYSTLGLSRDTIFAVYACLVGALHVCLICLWKGEPIRRLRAIKAEEAGLWSEEGTAHEGGVQAPEAGTATEEGTAKTVIDEKNADERDLQTPDAATENGIANEGGVQAAKATLATIEGTADERSVQAPETLTAEVTAHEGGTQLPRAKPAIEEMGMHSVTTDENMGAKPWLPPVICQNELNFEDTTVDESGGATTFPPPLHGLPLSDQIRSFDFFYALTFYFCHVFRSNAYMGTNKTWLETLGDEKHGFMYTQLFSLSMPISITFAPFIGNFLKTRGFGDGFALTLALGAAFNVLALVPHLQLQLLTFFCFTSFRACLYSIFFTHVGHTFGSRTSASIIALCSIVTTPLNFAIWPFFSWIVPTWGMQSFNAVLLAAAVPTILLTWPLRRRLQACPEADCRIISAATC